MKDDRVNFKMQEAKMMRFFKRIFLSSTQSYCCMQFRLLYHSSPLYENEAIVIQMGELCQQCAFDAWGIRYYTTHDHRLCTLPHADVSQRGVNFFIKSHFKLLKIENHVFNYCQSFSESYEKLLAAHVKDNINFGAGQHIRDWLYLDNQNFGNRS
jgi:hypothetical protein